MELNSESFDSQEMSCCHSPSPPSEAPDIGKWFSSYEYASPEVNFSESIMDFVREDDEDLHIQRNQNMNEMNVDSMSLPSEPPDIKNWFSSYMYESPELDNCGSLKMSVSEDIQLDHQENVINKKNDIAAFNKGRSPLESDGTNDVCYTDSVSLPSEPPDIRNWYSSYVYEPPDGELVLSYSKEIRSGNCDENERIAKRNGRKANCVISKCFNTRNKISVHEKDVFTDLKARHNHADFDTAQGNCRVEESGKSKNNNIFPILSDQIVKEKQTQYTNDSTSSMEQIVERTVPPPLKNKTVSDLAEFICSRKLLHGTSSIAKCTNSEPRSIEKVTSANPVVPLIKEPGKSYDSSQGNIQSDETKNRFISTKKNRRTIPNRNNPCLLQKQQIPGKDQNHFGITKKVQGSTIVGSKINVMSDVTNIQHSTEQEISGKWKCPQRSKSYLQPPMKQLRLEQWVTRA